MDSFYLTILSIATIILILALTYVGVLLYSTTSTKVFPPMQNACPDYWVLTDDGKCEFPPDENAKNRGNISTDTIEKWKVNDDRLNNLKIYNTSPDSVDSVMRRTTFDMNASGWGSVYGKKNALCNQKYWANSNRISWDGVSNTNQC